MIERLLPNSVIIHQESDPYPEPPIAVGLAQGCVIVMSQEGRQICIDIDTVKELIRELRAKVREATVAEAMQTGKKGG